MQIKKITSLVLAAALSISLAACGNSQTTAVTSGQDKQQAESTQTANSSEAKETESAQTENKTEDQQTETAAENESSAGNNILILYFSADNTKDVDAVSSATPMTDGTASVEWIANVIHNNVDGDLIPIIPSEDYPLEYEALADYAKKERDNGGRPAFEDLRVDPATLYSIPVLCNAVGRQHDVPGRSTDAGLYGYGRKRQLLWLKTIEGCVRKAV
jgi:hypothetical protein